MRNNEMHGKGVWVRTIDVDNPKNGKTIQTEETRRIQMADDERVRWISKPISEGATRIFLARFDDPKEFTGAFAFFVANELPDVPGGVDPENPNVKLVCREIIQQARGLLERLARENKGRILFTMAHAAGP